MQELISLFGGALLGYLFARLQRREENRERRTLLLEVLRSELNYLDPHVGPFRVGVAFHRNELVLLAPARLLDVLDYGDHAPLIRALLEFQVAVDRHNSLIRSVNLARCMGVAGDGERREVLQDLVHQHAAILTAAEKVRRFIPDSERRATRTNPVRRLLGAVKARGATGRLRTVAHGPLRANAGALEESP